MKMKNGFIDIGENYLKTIIAYRTLLRLYEDVQLDFSKKVISKLLEETKRKLQIFRILIRKVYELNDVKLRNLKEYEIFLLRDGRQGVIHLVRIEEIKKAIIQRDKDNKINII